MTIVGCGTGRCGTVSLATLLNDQEDWTCTHEMPPLLPWEIDNVLASNRIKHFNSHDKIGDIASYYLPYVEMMFEEIEDLKVICLKRKKKDTVKSYMAKMDNTDPPRNHWADHDGEIWTSDSRYDPVYPNYDLGLDLKPRAYKRELIRTHWEEYYEKANFLSEHYRNFEIFDLESLNSKQGQENIFEFLEIEDPNLQVGIKENELVSKLSTVSFERFMKTYIATSTVFLDFGAFIGNTVEKALEFYKPDRVLAFEPYQPHFAQLNERFGDNDKIKCFCKAIGTKDGISPLYFHRSGKDVGGHSMLAGKCNVGKGYEEVDVININDVLKDYANMDSTFIIAKFDIEGKEYEVLDELINSSLISTIDELFVDWHWNKIDSITESKHQRLVEKLNDLGFGLTGKNEDDEFMINYRV